MQTAFTAVVAHTSHIDIVDNRLVVNVGDVNATKVGDRPVVVEGATAPVATLKTNTAVPVTVVNTTVEAYVGAPVALVPRIKTVTPAPVSGRPQKPRGGRDYPSAGHPVVVIVAISPVTRRPDISNRRTRWLYVHRQSRWRDSDRNSNGNKREGRHRKCRQREPRYCGSGRSEATRFVVHDDLVALSERHLNAAADRFQKQIYATPLQR
jgi:hypothetical protein